MSSETCRALRGDLAARALGRDDLDVDPALDAHLDGCADCRAELDELRATATAALRADVDRLHVPVPAPALADQIVARMASEAEAADARHRAARRRRGRMAVAGLAGVAAAAAAAVVVIGTDDDGRGRTVELVGPGEADGSAVLIERAWGTEVELEVSGLHEGEVYWLWLTDETGDRVVAGTFTGTGRDTSAVLAAALPTDDTRRVWLTDEDDEVVLDAHLSAG